MKIIKQGVVPPPAIPRLYRGTCLNCQCVIEVDESEVTFSDEYPPYYMKGCPTPNCHWHKISVTRYKYQLPAATETVTWKTLSGARVKGVI
jgi:hypothetical protein